ncbi:hypothetical protein RSAG8_13846, partial [Rhizoctonia solani AG-8 WAC10335]
MGLGSSVATYFDRGRAGAIGPPATAAAAEMGDEE